MSRSCLLDNGHCGPPMLMSLLSPLLPPSWFLKWFWTHPDMSFLFLKVKMIWIWKCKVRKLVICLVMMGFGIWLTSVWHVILPLMALWYSLFLEFSCLWISLWNVWKVLRKHTSTPAQVRFKLDSGYKVFQCVVIAADLNKIDFS